ncbi:MAG: acetyl-CoA carboxylase carboxyltransferase subunit alpha [Cyanobacteria bacterium NC_groundwater_1444_Ag_S-0.65um_54_12]|nr:acetyl-CoA carboxylase carboxyltransferase subunit alpha [Cyanobacteria bacterium NC_groundwater_1444_Ag_S-0.65um_54_12]
MTTRNRLHFDFEKPIVEIEQEIEAFKQLAANNEFDIAEELQRLTERVQSARQTIYRHLRPSERVQIARHPSRPSALDYIQNICQEFIELHGDRQGHDDLAMIGGLARLDERTVVFVGQQKGRDTKDNILRNFGMAHPQGYRKALRLFRHAAKFGFPVVTLIDTPGAYPGIEAEKQGQSAAIAVNLMEMARLPVPIIAVVIGEGSSGGALGIGVADRILLLEHAYYAVISPEGCAAILWKDVAKAKVAAEALHMTAEDLRDLGLIDEIIPEPLGGAHLDPCGAARTLGIALRRQLVELSSISSYQLVEQRIAKYRTIGRYAEVF